MSYASALRLSLLAILIGASLPASALSTPGDVQSGIASYYAAKLHGRRTASGERFDANALTAAHKRLPFGSRVRVTDTRTGKSVIVEINDRGPYVKGRIIDLSPRAAKALGISKRGVARVDVEVLSVPDEST
jgi:rare lipoprotein A